MYYNLARLYFILLAILKLFFYFRPVGESHDARIAPSKQLQNISIIWSKIVPTYYLNITKQTTKKEVNMPP